MGSEPALNNFDQSNILPFPSCQGVMECGQTRGPCPSSGGSTPFWARKSRKRGLQHSKWKYFSCRKRWVFLKGGNPNRIKCHPVCLKAASPQRLLFQRLVQQLGMSSLVIFNNWRGGLAGLQSLHNPTIFIYFPLFFPPAFFFFFLFLPSFHGNHPQRTRR